MVNERGFDEDGNDDLTDEEKNYFLDLLGRSNVSSNPRPEIWIERNAMARRNGITLSSHSYVAMMLREPEEGDRFLNGRQKGIQVPVRTAEHCDHCETICPTKACVDGWSIDHIVLLDRTVAGRGIKEQLG